MNSTVFTVKNGCLICDGDVKGNRTANYYCKKCNVLFSQSDVDRRSVVLKPFAFVGSSKSNKYHKQGCICVKNIDKENILGFVDKDDAVQQMYKECKLCL